MEVAPQIKMGPYPPQVGPLELDGATPETYKRIRVRSRFERVVRNLKLIMLARERLGSVRPHFRLVEVAMRQNLHEQPALVRLALVWSIVTVLVQHLCHDFGESTLPAQYRPMREFIQVQTLLTEEAQPVAWYFAEARQTAQELNVDLRLPRTPPQAHPTRTPGPQRCDWPWRGADISYQGLVMPCCMVATPDRINFLAT